MKPFLKWAGGKRWLAANIAGRCSTEHKRYFEPFLGGAAVFFELDPNWAVLSDSNQDLIETYHVVRDDPQGVYSGLAALHAKHSAETYYRVRGSRPENALRRAIRFIYLNRTCWNGLYRVNRNNIFNVPIGTKSTVLFPDDDFEAWASRLRRADISSCDFEESIEKASGGDLIYVDPPYTVRHNRNGFLKYNQKMFSWNDQIRLRDSLVRAAGRDCLVFVSNADHESVRDLYREFGEVHSIPRSSVISGSVGHRGITAELLVIGNG
jgi:DNA adenine methylase